MKNSEFKSFKERVRTASRDDVVWRLGYMWLSLTNNQVNQLVDILTERGEIIPQTTFYGHRGLELPSGLIIWKEGE